MEKDEQLDKLLFEHKISQRTYDKVKVAKHYIERKYNLRNIKNAEWNNIIFKIDNLHINQDDKDKIKKEIYGKEMLKLRKTREKQSIRDYKSLSIIGRGAFGEVNVCREKKTGKIYAIKKIKKKILILKNQIIHVLNEQIFMSRVKSPWIVDLKASFQEDEYLYLVMEFLPGGDLMNLFIKKDILTEDEARFYISELILAIESIHNLDCIHRDIKPDNILIDKDGHIKLSDFGLAKISDKLYEKENNQIYDNGKTVNNFERRHNKNFSCVGTAYYVAPEVLKKTGYEKDIDWWSVGVIFYEMLVGYAPFCSKETNQVCYKVLNWEKYLKIPSKIKMSDEARDLIYKMINNSSDRLGKNGADEIKRHPFFNGVDWENIRSSTPPFIPTLKNECDTKYFEKFEEKESFYPKQRNKYQRNDIEYLGYTYKEDEFNNDINTEFEQAIKTIIHKNSSQTINISDNNEENIDINIKHNITKKHCSLRKLSTTKIKKKIPTPNIKTIARCTTITSYNKEDVNNNKLNIINLPLKRGRQSILNKKIKKIIQCMNSKSLNKISKDVICTSSDRNIKINFGQMPKKNLYMKKKAKNISLNDYRNNLSKFSFNNLYKNIKKRLSPQPRKDLFIKKYFINKKSLKEKLNYGNKSFRDISKSNGQKLFIKSPSSNYIKKNNNSINNPKLKYLNPEKINNINYINEMKLKKSENN